MPQVADLNGEWKLVYTSNSELTALLALSRLPFVAVGDITQTIDGPSMTVTNKVRVFSIYEMQRKSCVVPQYSDLHSLSGVDTAMFCRLDKVQVHTEGHTQPILPVSCHA